MSEQDTVGQSFSSAVATLRHPKAEVDVLTRASMQIDAVTMGLEVASQAILDAAERIGDLIDDARQGDETAVERIADCIIDIYENCEFQDISGQRLTNVAAAISRVSMGVDDLINLVGEDAVSSLPIPEAPEGEDALLNGPQLTGEGAAQSDIDQMFD